MKIEAKHFLILYFMSRITLTKTVHAVYQEYCYKFLGVILIKKVLKHCLKCGLRVHTSLSTFGSLRL